MQQSDDQCLRECWNGNFAAETIHAGAKSCTVLETSWDAGRRNMNAHPDRVVCDCWKGGQDQSAAGLLSQRMLPAQGASAGGAPALPDPRSCRPPCPPCAGSSWPAWRPACIQQGGRVIAYNLVRDRAALKHCIRDKGSPLHGPVNQAQFRWSSLHMSLHNGAEAGRSTATSETCSAKL